MHLTWNLFIVKVPLWFVIKTNVDRDIQTENVCDICYLCLAIEIAVIEAMQ